jgi:hypothetical protein
VVVVVVVAVAVAAAVLISTSETENVCGKYQGPRSYVAECAYLRA